MSGNDGKGRRDWEANHEKIKSCMKTFLNQKKRAPKIMELADLTGLGQATIERHIAALKTDPKRFDHLRILTEDVIMGMYRAASGPRADSKAAKFFVQFVEDWVEKKRVSVFDENPYAGVTREELTDAIKERMKGLLGKEKGNGPSA